MNKSNSRYSGIKIPNLNSVPQQGKLQKTTNFNA